MNQLRIFRPDTPSNSLLTILPTPFVRIRKHWVRMDVKTVGGIREVLLPRYCLNQNEDGTKCPYCMAKLACTKSWLANVLVHRTDPYTPIADIIDISFNPIMYNKTVYILEMNKIIHEQLAKLSIDSAYNVGITTKRVIERHKTAQLFLVHQIQTPDVVCYDLSLDLLVNNDIGRPIETFDDAMNFVMHCHYINDKPIIE